MGGSGSGSGKMKGKQKGNETDASNETGSDSGKKKDSSNETAQFYWEHLEKESPANTVKMYGYVNSESKEFQFYLDITGKIGVTQNSAAMVWATIASVEFSSKEHNVFEAFTPPETNATKSDSKKKDSK